MPTNLFGPGDNFDYQNSHVLPALLRKFHDAHTKGTPSVSVWGTGRALREFLHVDDLADASVFLMKNYDDGEIVNVGSGEEVSIKALAEMIQKVIGYRGIIDWDQTKPDGTPRKLLDCSKIHKMGWKPTHTLESGIRTTYEWFLSHLDQIEKKL
jgi:GDP-L-fucose synthase